jgi:O-antigen/teichoic acid export membrane protein
MSSFIKDLSRVGLSNVFIIITGIGTSIVTARYIGPEGNGTVSGLTIYPSLFMTIGSLGIRQSTAYYLGKEIYEENQIKTAVTQIWMMTSIFSIIVSFFLMHYLSKSGANLHHVLLALLPIPFSLFITYNSGVFLGKNDIKSYNKINWIPSLLAFLSTILFVAIFKLDITGALMALIAGPLTMAFVLLFKNKFINSFSLKFNWKIMKGMLSLGIVYATSLLVINLNYKADVILLDKLGSAYELGIYSKGAAITQYLWQIPMLLSTIVFSRSAISKDGHMFSLKIAQLLRLSFLIIGLGSILLWLFSKYIIIGMYGSKFSGSVAVLNYLLPGVVVLTLFKVMNMDLAGKGKPWIAMKAMVPALILNVILNILTIPKYGANGSAISSTISYTFAGVLFLFFYSKEVMIPIKTILFYKKSDFDPIMSILNKILKP